MKVFVILFAVCAIVKIEAGKITEDEKKLLDAFKSECIAETGVDVGTDTLSGTSDNSLLKKAEKEQKLIDDDKFACFTSCMLQKVGFMSEDGKLEEEMIGAILTSKLSEEVANAAIKNCKNEVGKNVCDTAVKLVTCFVQNKAVLTV